MLSPDAFEIGWCDDFDRTVGLISATAACSCNALLCNALPLQQNCAPQ